MDFLLAVLGLRRCVDFPLVVAGGSHSPRWRLRWRSRSSGHTGWAAAAPGLQSTGSVVAAHGLSCSVACGMFSDQGWTRVSCIVRLTLNHWSTRKSRTSSVLMSGVEYEFQERGPKASSSWLSETSSQCLPQADVKPSRCPRSGAFTPAVGLV